jgi:hypothetical protein
VEEEMAAPPADAPGRRALFERVKIRAAMRRRVEEIQLRTENPEHRKFDERHCAREIL